MSCLIIADDQHRGEKRHLDIVDPDVEGLPKKKKYAKEAWPGRKPGPGQGLF